ncbi:signal peptidase II [Candidatus Dojkabacteria bacterium]|uniref:Signal peptidase II n=1 Tax=Candidatus Dojkabacteria bacterium TaxID=2099670 RepID=A0A952AG21_9BACT|nr:signal peptidase II [Candidatus Dojkabacteria bacterium]
MAKIPINKNYLFSVISILFIADRLLKLIAIEHLDYTINQSLALGIGTQDNTQAMIFSVFGLLISIIIIFQSRSTIGAKWLWIVMLLLLSGAFSNLFDRLAYGGVVDFIAIGSFPWFNLADVYITSALGLFLMLSLANARASKIHNKI